MELVFSESMNQIEGYSCSIFFLRPIFSVTARSRKENALIRMICETIIPCFDDKIGIAKLKISAKVCYHVLFPKDIDIKTIPFSDNSIRIKVSDFEFHAVKQALEKRF